MPEEEKKEETPKEPTPPPKPNPKGENVIAYSEDKEKKKLITLDKRRSS
jgi:hypothetical protein